jgi:hypothetical protein
MLVPAIADDIATTYNCKVGCGRKIRKGQVVLHLKLGNDMPFDQRHMYFHASCLASIMADAHDLEVATSDSFMDEMLAGLRGIAADLSVDT